MANPSMSVKSCSTLVKWVGIPDTHGETRHLFQSKPDILRKVTFDIYFDPASKAAFFKIQAPVDIEGEITMLYLYINPDRITSLVYVGSKDIPGTLPCLRFGLSKPPDLVVPTGDSLTLKRPNIDAITLESLKVLAQETAICIYMAHDDLPETLLQALCAAVTDETLKPHDTSFDLRDVYQGRGARVLRGADLQLPPSPPSYGEVQASQAPGSSQETVPASLFRKRPRVSSSGSSENDTANIFRKQPRVGSSSSSGNISEDIRAEYSKKPVRSHFRNQFEYQEFVRFRDEFQQMRTIFVGMEESSQQMKMQIKGLEEESQQMKTKIQGLEDESKRTKAEMAIIKEMTMTTDSQKVTETATEDLTLSQHMRTRLDVYSKAEVESLVYDGVRDAIASEELCNQQDMNAHLEEFEENFDGYNKSQVDAKLEEERVRETWDLARDLGGYFCDADDVKEILEVEMGKVYTKIQVDRMVYDVWKTCEGLNRLQTEELVLGSREELEKDVANEIKVAKGDLREWAQNVLRLEMIKAVRSKIERRRLSHMPPPWRKFSRRRIVIVLRNVSTVAASSSSTASFISSTSGFTSSTASVASSTDSPASPTGGLAQEVPPPPRSPPFAATAPTTGSARVQRRRAFSTSEPTKPAVSRVQRWSVG